ncbi:MAG: trans-aconitate 2-methyltransferase [Planctomycetota bacterium]
MASPTFDACAHDYEVQLAQGLSLSGEGREYFSRARCDHLRTWWTRAGFPEPRALVDLGCGDGLGTLHLAERFPAAEVLGVDPSQASLDLARSRLARSRGPSDQDASARVRFEPDAKALRGRADLVHVNGVLHHVEPVQRPGFLSELRSLLDPSGTAAIFENNPLNPGTRWVMSRIPFDRDARPLSCRRLVAALEDAGLEVAHTRHLFYFPRLLSALRPLEGPLGRLPLGAQYAVLAKLAKHPSGRP